MVKISVQDRFKSRAYYFGKKKQIIYIIFIINLIKETYIIKTEKIVTFDFFCSD